MGLLLVTVRVGQTQVYAVCAAACETCRTKQLPPSRNKCRPGRKETPARENACSVQGAWKFFSIKSPENSLARPTMETAQAAEEAEKGSGLTRVVGLSLSNPQTPTPSCVARMTRCELTDLGKRTFVSEIDGSRRKERTAGPLATLCGSRYSPARSTASSPGSSSDCLWCCIRSFTPSFQNGSSLRRLCSKGRKSIGTRSSTTKSTSTQPWRRSRARSSPSATARPSVLQQTPRGLGRSSCLMLGAYA